MPRKNRILVEGDTYLPQLVNLYIVYHHRPAMGRYGEMSSAFHPVWGLAGGHLLSIDADLDDSVLLHASN